MKGILKYEVAGRPQFFRVESAAPLDLPEFREVLQGKRSIHPSSFRGFPCSQDGQRIGPKSVLSSKVGFRKNVPFYGLVPGGVLPPAYLPDGVVLLDRNAVEACKVPADHPEAKGKEWWFELLNRKENVLNPCMAAFEGRERQTPRSFKEFASELHATRASVEARLPQASVVAFDEARLLDLYEFRRSFDQRQASESGFLQRIAPILANRVAESKLDAKRSEVLKITLDFGLDRRAFVVIAALAKLYESTSSTGNLLKFRPSYTEGDAYNAIADLRQLELLACSQGFPQSFALLTNDDPLALFWCGLGVEQVDLVTNARISFSPHPDLFPRLPEGQLGVMLGG